MTKPKRNKRYSAGQLVLHTEQRLPRRYHPHPDVTAAIQRLTAAELKSLLVEIFARMMRVLILFASRQIDRPMSASKNGG